MEDREVHKVIILGTAWPFRGGIAAFNERLAVEYQRRGCQVEIVGFSLQYPKFLFPGKTQYSTAPAPPNLTIRQCVNSINPFNWLMVGRMLKRERPDLLIVPFWLPFMGPCLGTIAGMVRNNHATHVISLVHNMIPHERRFGDRMFARYFVRRVDGFLALSSKVLGDIGSFNAHKKMIHSPHPLYDHYGEVEDPATARKALNLPEKGKYLLFFGLIRDYKGLDLLLRAMADERIKALDIHLMIAGEFYSDPAHYLYLIEVLKLSDRVILHNEFIPDNRVALYFNAADLVVQPYKSATQSGVTQIAYHFEKPMVVTNVGGLSELVPHGVAGYVVAPEHGAVADAIVDFFAGHNAEKLTEGVRKQKARFSWSQLVDALHELL